MSYHKTVFIGDQVEVDLVGRNQGTFLEDLIQQLLSIASALKWYEMKS